MKSKSQKEILFYMTSLQVGGGERVMVDLMSKFSKKGFNVSLAVINYEGLMKKSLSQDVKVFDFKKSSIFVSFLKLCFLVFRLKPRVLFSSTFHLNPFIVPASVFSFKKTKTVIRIGNPLSLTFDKYQGFKDGFLIPLLTRIFYKRATKIICVSQGIAQDTRQYLNYHGKNLKVIYSPKDYEALKKKGEEYIPSVFKNKQTKFLLFVGRLVEQKDPETLIRAMSFLKNKNVHLVLVGGGGMESKLKILAQDLGVTNQIYFEGPQDNPYVYMKNADIFVLPSRWEGMPNVLLESLAFDMVVVASDCFPGSAREFLAPETNISFQITEGIEETSGGFLFPVGRGDLLAQAVMKSLHKTNISEGVAKNNKMGNMEEYDTLFDELTK